MLTMTEQAITTLSRIEAGPQVPRGAGLRIATRPDDATLTFRLAAAPHQGDEIIARSGVMLFLDYEAAIALADKTLDVSQDASGRLQFNLTDQEH